MLYVGSRHCRPVHHRPELSRRSNLQDEETDAHLLYPELDVAQLYTPPSLALAATPILVAIFVAPVATARHRCSAPATIATVTHNLSFVSTAIPARSAAPLAAAA